MRKILALLLVVALIVGMMAGCKKKAENIEEPQTEPTVSEVVDESEEENPEQTNPPQPSTQPNQYNEDDYLENNETPFIPEEDDSNLVVIDGKQEFWEEAFGGSEFKLDASSFKITMSNNAAFTVISDEHSVYLEISDPTNEDCSAIYQIGDDKAYYFERKEGAESWQKCTNVNATIGKDALNGIGNPESFQAQLDQGQIVEYIGTDGEVDKLKIYSSELSINVPEIYLDEGETLVRDFLFYAMDEDGSGTYRYIEIENTDGEIESRIETIEQEGELSIHDWDLDPDTMMMTNVNDDSYTIGAIKKHASDYAVGDFTTLTVYINPETLDIVEIAFVDQITGIYLDMEIIECEKVTDIIKIENIKGEIEYDNASMNLGMQILMLMMTDSNLINYIANIFNNANFQ